MNRIPARSSSAAPKSAPTTRTSSLVLALCLFVLVGTAVASAPEPRIAPDWTLETPEGRAVQLSEVVGEQTTVLFFWATWCPYCKALMPHLQSMRIEYGEELGILAINVFEDGDPVEFIRDNGYDFTLLLNGDKVAESYGISGTPGVLVVDSERAVTFDLREIPRPAKATAPESASNSRKAAYLAPYWAAEIRKAVDAVRRHSPEGLTLE